MALVNIGGVKMIDPMFFKSSECFSLTIPFNRTNYRRIQQ